VSSSPTRARGSLTLPSSSATSREAPNTAQIQAHVRQGYYIRTRSDVPLATVRTGDTSMLEAALVSGAHVISTDFPEVA
jgi:hypothetical protein